MLNKQRCGGLLLAAGLGLMGCDKSNDVKEEIQELEQAQQQAPQEAQELQQELEQKKQEIANLEEKLALAKQGVTDEVREEKKDVKEAMKEQAEDVRDEIQEAQGLAQEHRAESEQAAQKLQEVEGAQRVKAHVKTETNVVPGQTHTEVKTTKDSIPVVNSHVVERTTNNAAGRDGGM